MGLRQQATTSWGREPAFLAVRQVTAKCAGHTPREQSGEPYVREYARPDW